MRLRKRKRGVTYVEVVVATAFVGICAATLLDSVNLSLQSIAYTQRRSIVFRSMQGAIDEVRSQALTALPTNGTSNGVLTLGGKTVNIATVISKVSSRNVVKVVSTATWPESRGSRFFTDTLTLECYVKGPDAPSD